MNTNSLEEEREWIERILNERLEAHDKSRRYAQERLEEICGGLEASIDGLENKVNGELEERSTTENNRLQSALDALQMDNGDVSKMFQRARAGLLVTQSYEIILCGMKGGSNGDELQVDLESLCELKTEKRVTSLELTAFERRKPKDLAPSFTERGDLSLSFTFFNEDEMETLKGSDLPFEMEVKVWEKGHKWGTSKTFAKKYAPGSDEGVYIRTTFTTNTTYCLKMRIISKGVSTQWSDETEFTTGFRECCMWKKCPDYVNEERKYSVDEENPRAAAKIGDGFYCTIIGNTPLPLNTVTSWSIKVLKSYGNNGNGIFVGVAPSDINQNEDESFIRCGWYFYCCYSALCSGPPHNYYGKDYGPRKGDGEYVRDGDSVSVVMDTAKGELSFVVDGVNLGVAYEGIPLDKPLVPCAILCNEGDSVELDTSEVKENVDSSIPVPSNITAKSITWDSITLTWDAVEGASFYQIEVDESKSWSASTASTFTQRKLLPDTEHSFRVRTVRGSSVSKWSDVVKGQTAKAHDFSECCMWKECPGNVNNKRKYSVDAKNSRVATKTNGDAWCTIIGNTALPPSTVISWSIKVLKSKNNDGSGIIIGIAPSDINQNEDDNSDKCGWYFACYSSTLWSGPPHDYEGKEYGPRKGDGEYVRDGDSVGVVMNTAKGELSFVVNGVNLGVAYEGIPLDKPLVPCVLLFHDSDSIESVI